jgi:hypothetical protein
MAKNLIEYNAYTADIVSYDNYDSLKTVLGPEIYKISGSTPIDYYIGPKETVFRDITQDTGVSNWGDLDAITYKGNKQWLFCLKGFAVPNTTTDIAMYEFDKTDYTYTYKGEIRTANASDNPVTQQGISANLDYYSAGTVSVNGTSVSGTGTNWIEGRIPIGARIGFGSTNPEDITTWYRITNYPLMNSTPTKTNGAVYCTTVDPTTGKIYIGGNFTTWDGVAINRIARLNTDGTLDTSFNPGSGFNDVVRVITLDSSGKLYVGGQFTTYNGVANNRIIKLDGNGTKDATFVNTTGFNAVSVYVITLDSSGNLYVGGQFTTWKGVASSAPYIIKLTPTGDKDATFVNTTGFDTGVYVITLDSSGNLYVGGHFTTWKGVASSAPYIIKLTPTGDKDATFVNTVGPNAQVYSIHHKTSTNTIIVGGSFTQWKGVNNFYLTELSSTGDALISSASSINVYGLSPDSLGNIYCYAGSQLITKRNINTLTADPTFTPNIIYVTNTQTYNKGTMAVNLTNDRLYVCSGSFTVDSGIVCVETTGGTRDMNFLTSQDYTSQSITINVSAGILPPGTPYVIEDLKIYVQRGGSGVNMIQGISVEDFSLVPTNILAPSFNFMGLSKGRYVLQDGAYNTSNGFQGGTSNSTSCKDLRIIEKENSNTHYLYGISNSGRISIFNVKSPYITQLGTGIQGTLRYNTTNQLLVTGNGVNQFGAGIGGSVSGKFTIGTMQSGSAVGEKSIFLDSSGVVQIPLSKLENQIQPVYNYMLEVPPGSTTTYVAAGNVGRVYYISEIDKLIILNSSITAKSYITGFNVNLQQPTLSGTLYGRDTYNELAIKNSYDLAFLVNGQQLQGNTSNSYSPKYPDTLGTGFFGSGQKGVFHMCRPLATIQNNLYAVSLECESEYVDFSNNAFITPKLNLPNTINISGVYLNSQKEYGTFPFNIPPEPIIIDYRTDGIDDNSGSWKRFNDINSLNNDIICEGVLNNITIQFRFSYKIAGNTCLTNKIYGFSLIYEDDRTDSNYSPSVSNSSLNNRTFAWRQDKSWFGNIPDLKIRLYNSSNNTIVYYDTVTTSGSGTWEYSTDGINWLPWNSTADNIGNYIRYVADFIPNGIKLRVGLNRI